MCPVGSGTVDRADLNKRPGEVARMFDGVARGYDRTNAVLSGGNSALWRRLTVRAIDPKPGERVLDVAAGTGTSSAAIARSGAKVTGLDFSEGMLAEARRRHPELEFVHGDAEALPFPDEHFDAVTISFGLRNVQHPQLALAEMYRVLVPGGRVVVCEFSRPPRALFKAGYDAYLRYLMPLISSVTGSNAPSYDYLRESIEHWPEQGELAGWMRGVGFSRVGYRNLTAGVVALHRGRKPQDTALREAAARTLAGLRRGAGRDAADAAGEAEAAGAAGASESTPPSATDAAESTES